MQVELFQNAFHSTFHCIYQIKDHTKAILLKKKMQTFLDTYHQKWSMFIKESDFYCIENTLSLDKHSELLIKEATQYSMQTNGLFDICIGEMTYANKMNTISNNHPSYLNIKLENHLLKTNKKLKIDVGSIAKGYVLDVFVKYAKVFEIEDIFINFGGSVYSLKPRMIKIRHHQDIASLLLEDEFLICSGEPYQTNHHYHPHLHTFTSNYDFICMKGKDASFLDAFTTILLLDDSYYTLLPKDTFILCITKDKDIFYNQYASKFQLIRSKQ